MAQTEEMDEKIQKILGCQKIATEIIKELKELHELRQVVQYLDGLIDDNRELTEADYQTWGRIYERLKLMRDKTKEFDAWNELKKE